MLGNLIYFLGFPPPLDWILSPIKDAEGITLGTCENNLEMVPLQLTGDNEIIRVGPDPVGPVSLCKWGSWTRRLACTEGGPRAALGRAAPSSKRSSHGYQKARNRVSFSPEKEPALPKAVYFKLTPTFPQIELETFS